MDEFAHRFKEGCLTSSDGTFTFHCNKTVGPAWGTPGHWLCTCKKHALNGDAPSYVEHHTKDKMLKPLIHALNDNGHNGGCIRVETSLKRPARFHQSGLWPSELPEGAQQWPCDCGLFTLGIYRNFHVEYLDEDPPPKQTDLIIQTFVGGEDVTAQLNS